MCWQTRTTHSSYMGSLKPGVLCGFICPHALQIFIFHNFLPTNVHVLPFLPSYSTSYLISTFSFQTFLLRNFTFHAFFFRPFPLYRSWPPKFLPLSTFWYAPSPTLSKNKYLLRLSRTTKGTEREQITLACSEAANSKRGGVFHLRLFSLFNNNICYYSL